jgi:aldehyde dehydrogenase (NAD+)
MGQPITLAKRMILSPAATWRYYAGHAGKVAGESYPPDEDGMYKIVQYEPLGESFCLPAAVDRSIDRWND